MKAIIIARVSTKEQEDTSSIPAQTHRLKEYTQRNSLEIHKIVELTESSTKESRKKFEALLEEIRSLPESIAVIADTVDRMQRSFKESVELDEMRKQGKI